MTKFLQCLHTQRMDDHRYYHHSRINQSLHFISAISFVVAYVFLFIHPAWAALIAWFISMPSRQAGHFFFEPRGYDEVNQATHEHKEDIKLGYNLQRKVVLMSLWAAIPHYASNSPSPKATLALVNALEDFLEISLPQGELHAEALEWESEVDELAREDSDVAEYVKALEESKDSALLSDVSGEELARELERFLRRQSES